MCRMQHLGCYHEGQVHSITQTPHSGYVTLCYFNHCQHKNHVTMVYHVIDSKLYYVIYYTHANSAQGLRHRYAGLKPLPSYKIT